MKLVIALAFALALTGSHVALAESAVVSQGSGLLNACEVWKRVARGKTLISDSPEEIAMAIGCFNYIEGAVEGLALVSDQVTGMCAPNFPTDVTFEQYTRVVLKHLQDHPESLHLRSIILVHEALIAAFGCTQR